jgi:hypothetical protein
LDGVLATPNLLVVLNVQVTKLTIYKATVLTILLYCAETWSTGPEDVRKLETAQMFNSDNFPPQHSDHPAR